MKDWKYFCHVSAIFCAICGHLFRSMQRGFSEQHLQSYEDVKIWFGRWLAWKDEKFFWSGIHSLPKRWEKVITNDGHPHSTEIFRKYCNNIPWKYCKIAKIFRNLSLMLLKYCNNLAMSAQNMMYAIFSKYCQKLANT